MSPSSRRTGRELSVLVPKVLQLQVLRGYVRSVLAYHLAQPRAVVLDLHRGGELLVGLRGRIFPRVRRLSGLHLLEPLRQPQRPLPDDLHFGHRFDRHPHGPAVGRVEYGVVHGDDKGILAVAPWNPGPLGRAKGILRLLGEQPHELLVDPVQLLIPQLRALGRAIHHAGGAGILVHTGLEPFVEGVNLSTRGPARKQHQHGQQRHIPSQAIVPPIMFGLNRLPRLFSLLRLALQLLLRLHFLLFVHLGDILLPLRSKPVDGLDFRRVRGAD